MLAAGGERRHRLQVGLAFFVGTAVVLLWPLSVFAQAPHACLLNIVTLPKLYAQWHHEQGSVHNKVDLSLICLTTLGYQFLLTAMLSAFVGSALTRKTSCSPRRGRQRFLAALVGGFVVIAFVPPTMWQQYWAVPVPLMVLSMAYPLQDVWQKRGQYLSARLAIALIMGCALLAIGAHAVKVWQAPPLLSPISWAPSRPPRPPPHLRPHTPGRAAPPPGPHR